MSKSPSNENPARPPPRDLVREARRLARLRHLRLVANEPRLDNVPATHDPKEAA